MTDSVEMSEIQSVIIEFSTKCTEILSKKYGFDLLDGLKFLDLLQVKNSSKKSKKNIPIPFCGEINENWCNAIRLNYGLYTQCMNSKEKNNNYCKTCIKQCIKSGSNIPTYGTIQMRMDEGKNFKDSKGKAPVRYANIMKKFEISQEEAKLEARKYNFIIPDEEFEIKEVKRGRPKKTVSVSDTESETSVETKKRGRPKKNKQVISELATGDELIAGLLKEAGISESHIKEDKVKADELKKDDHEDDDDDEEEEIEVTKFTDPKTKIEYYKTDSNILYNMESEPVGRWDEKKQMVVSI